MNMLEMQCSMKPKSTQSRELALLLYYYYFPTFFISIGNRIRPKRPNLLVLFVHKSPHSHITFQASSTLPPLIIHDRQVLSCVSNQGEGKDFDHEEEVRRVTHPSISLSLSSFRRSVVCNWEWWAHTRHDPCSISRPLQIDTAEWATTMIVLLLLCLFCGASREIILSYDVTCAFHRMSRAQCFFRRKMKTLLNLLRCGNIEGRQQTTALHHHNIMREKHTTK